MKEETLNKNTQRHKPDIHRITDYGKKQVSSVIYGPLRNSMHIAREGQPGLFATHEKDEQEEYEDLGYLGGLVELFKLIKEHSEEGKWGGADQEIVRKQYKGVNGAGLYICMSEPCT